MKTVATLCAGGELFGVGARAAGLRHLWGIESVPAIAGVAEDNGFCIVTAKIQEVDYASLESPWWLHMSPPCINASQAKANAGETELDIELARACINAIETLAPPMVSLENVWGYRKFESFKLICRALREAGYALDYWRLNAADYGVPQTRQRLFLVASRVQRPRKPDATHQRARPSFGQLSLLDALPPWRGWYGAIEDLMPDLPDDEFAPWQEKRLPDELRTLLMGSHKGERSESWVEGASPAPTVTASSGGRVRALLVPGGNASDDTLRTASELCVTLSGPKSTSTMRAFLVNGAPDDNGRSLTIRGGNERFITASASQEKRAVRAYAGGRVVRVTARAVARFQSVPDDYRLTGKKGLDFRVIGNGVPPLMAEVLIRANESRNW